MLGIPARRRPMLRIESVVLIVVAYLIATANGSWWNAALADRAWTQSSNWLFVAGCFVLLLCAHFALLAAVSNRWILRPLLTVVVVTSAAAAHFMQTFSVILDPTMVQNILHTDAHESRDLMSWALVGNVLLWSALPVAFIWFVRIEHHRWPKATLIRIGSIVAALVLAVIAALAISRDLTSLLRSHHEMRYLVTPGNFIYGLVANSARGVRNVDAPREPVGTDARVIHLAVANKPPRVFVLVVGETARAANFSLMGYGRETNPELAKLGVLAFNKVTSCGTSTEVSVPCMFSPYGRSDYDETRIRNSETLLDVLERAGYAVKWIDNQSGCKGVCKGAGIEYVKLDAAAAPDLCEGGECLDGALVRRLAAELDSVRKDTVFVLHMMGNHGPAYYKRYPPQFERFTPDCATAQLRDCTRDQVVNTYDNAILYTDHVLAQMVRTLSSRAPLLQTALLYVSDHGESLGEKGLYLHGMPYAIAPSTQTHVPMVAWLSSGFAADGGVDVACVRQKADDDLSHDNLFHSVLGLLDVATGAYRSERDIFGGCRMGRGRAYASS